MLGDGLKVFSWTHLLLRIWQSKNHLISKDLGDFKCDFSNLLEKWTESGQIVSNNIRIWNNSCNQNIPLKTYNLWSKVYPNVCIGK